MRVAVCSTESTRSGASPAELLVRGSPPAGWSLTDDTDLADVIIFAESHRDDAACGRFLQNVARHPVYTQNRERCVVHYGGDHVVPVIPGFYPSVERRWHAGWWTRSASYLVEANPFLESEAQGPRAAPDVLASFVGACRGKAVRLRMCEIGDDRLDVRDTGGEFVAALRAKDIGRVADLKRLYVNSMLRSIFVLCPRGTGASSIRLFEAMQLGRAPVIVSDDWVEPEGPDWSAFSVRVAESDIADLPGILAAREGDAEAMGCRAAEAWAAWYAPSVLLARITLEAVDLLALANGARARGWLWSRSQLARPRSVRILTRGRG